MTDAAGSYRWQMHADTPFADWNVCLRVIARRSATPGADSVEAMGALVHMKGTLPLDSVRVDVQLP